MAAIRFRVFKILILMSRTENKRLFSLSDHRD